MTTIRFRLQSQSISFVPCEQVRDTVEDRLYIETSLAILEKQSMRRSAPMYINGILVLVVTGRTFDPLLCLLFTYVLRGIYVLDFV